MIDSKKKFWTAVFVITLTLFSGICIFRMNANYDSLARYPYTDQKSRKLIKEYLNNEEIEYIIEYSIAPNMFVAYIQEPGFNIYHAAEYKQLSAYAWNEKAGDIVKMVEETRNVMDTTALIGYLQNYSYSELKYFLDHGDEFQPGNILRMDATNEAVYIHNDETIGVRIPPSLVAVDNEIIDTDKPLTVERRVAEPLRNLCGAIENDLSSEQACAGLRLTDGYISYEQQKQIYTKAKEADGDSVNSLIAKPGHDEHQLGLAIDFAVDGIKDEDFEKTAQAQWLKENAWRYGFVESRSKSDETLTGLTAQPMHYRYVGAYTAQSIWEKGTTFAQFAKK